jgi:hypothetical protein
VIVGIAAFQTKHGFVHPTAIAIAVIKRGAISRMLLAGMCHVQSATAPQAAATYNKKAASRITTPC